MALSFYPYLFWVNTPALQLGRQVVTSSFKKSSFTPSSKSAICASKSIGISREETWGRCRANAGQCRGRSDSIWCRNVIPSIQLSVVNWNCHSNAKVLPASSSAGAYMLTEIISFVATRESVRKLAGLCGWWIHDRSIPLRHMLRYSVQRVRYMMLQRKQLYYSLGRGKTGPGAGAGCCHPQRSN